MHHLKPGDWVKQSIPFSYMAFTAESLNGTSHAVQVYSDVSGGACDRSPKPSFLSSFVTEWNSGNRNQAIRWTTVSNANAIYHSINLETPAVFNEIIDQADWGTLYYATQTVSDTNPSAFLLTIYDAGDQRYVQDCAGCGLSRSICDQWNVKRSRR